MGDGSELYSQDCEGLMGLRDIIANASAQAFGAIGDLAEDCTLQRWIEGDRVNGKLEYNLEDSTNGKAVRENYTAFEVQSIAAPGDVKATLRSKGLKFFPLVGDALVFPDANYAIHSVTPLPVGPNPSVFILQCRREKAR